MEVTTNGLESPTPQSTESSLSWDLCDKGSEGSTRWMIVQSCLSLVGDKSGCASEEVKGASSMSSMSMDTLQNVSDCESVVSSAPTGMDSPVSVVSDVKIVVDPFVQVMLKDVRTEESVCRHFINKEFDHFFSLIRFSEPLFREWHVDIPAEGQFFRLVSPHNTIRRRATLISSLVRFPPFLLTPPPERGIHTSRFEGRGRLIMLWYIILPGAMLSVCGFLILSSH
eukprot:TRINITY_DN7012_c4_g1_i1.p1 TRINITY_DN7012_c4_g1~~TRINITY_DN7012_c4_g1_i1.p1  ORF type:complete len:226 (+),score=24.50 TRINITY_DN7012_c4_g1_i1:68-745(+)